MSGTPPTRTGLGRFIHDYRVLFVGIPFLVAVHLAWYQIQLSETIRPNANLEKDKDIFSRIFRTKKSN